MQCKVLSNLEFMNSWVMSRRLEEVVGVVSECVMGKKEKKKEGGRSESKASPVLLKYRAKYEVKYVLLSGE